MNSRPHPWHGISPGENAPNELTAYIEMTPYDRVKYEVDKETGYLMLDRPQKFSSLLPALYGFVPKTYCGDKTAKNFEEACSKELKEAGLSVKEGDGDPLDIIVLCDREITRADLLVKVIPIGGFRMLDGGEADDKIVAIVKGDDIYDNWTDITEMPERVVNRLKHYLLSYKQMPDEDSKVAILKTYGKEEAMEVINVTLEDYNDKF